MAIFLLYAIIVFIIIYKVTANYPICNYGDIDGTFTDINSNKYYINASIGLNEDHILHSFLKNHKVKYKILDQRHEGKIKNDSNSKLITIGI
jgi:hypothetical protein